MARGNAIVGAVTIVGIGVAVIGGVAIWKLGSGGLRANPEGPQPFAVNVPEGEEMFWTWGASNSSGSFRELQWEVYVDPDPTRPLDTPTLVGPVVSFPPRSILTLITDPWVATGLGTHVIEHVLRLVPSGKVLARQESFVTVV